VIFQLADTRITEASGIAIGVRSAGVDYVQNDSGDRNRYFAVDARTGATAATVTVTGADNVDWEDIAVGPGRSGVSSVWLADIGDNDAVRPEVQVYRVPEPHVLRSAHGRVARTPRAEVWRLRYPTGPVNAEGLAVAPDGRAYIVTKSPLGASTVYLVPARPDRRHVQSLQRVGAVQLLPHGTPNPFGVAGELTVTGAAISPDGALFAVRTYAEAYVWPVVSGDVAAALRTPPTRVRLPRQGLGEGIALTDDRTAVIDSEGAGSAVYTVPLPPIGSRAAVAASGPADPPSRVASAAARPTGRPQREASPWWWAAATAAGVAVLTAAGWGWRRSRIRSCRSPRSTRPSP
jgi:hypothetical protein